MAQTINVDVTSGLFQPTLYYHQGDIGREFAINISTKDGYQIPTGATAKIEATKPSGLGFSVSGTLSGNVVSFVSTEGMTDEWGRFPAQLKISSGNTVIYTANFLMVGEKNAHPASTTDGSQEEIVSEITLLVERAEAAASTAARVFFGYLYGAVLDWNTMLGEYADSYSLQSSVYNTVNDTIVFAFSAVDGSNSVLMIEVDRYYNVLQRKSLTLYHANDITYNPTTQKIYISNDTINGQIDVVDASDFTLDTPIDTGLNATISMISYDNTKDIYYVSTSDRKIYTLDNQFGNANYISNLEYNANPTSFGHDYIKAVYYQGSSVIRGRFVYMLWFYAEDNSNSFVRLYSVNAYEKKTEDFIEIPMKHGTYEESECVVVIGNMAYLYGYINNKIITITELFIDGELKNDWSFIQHLPLCDSSGELVSFPDGAHRVDVDSLLLDIDYTSSEKSSITIMRTGKNLVKNEATSTTSNGITFTVNDDGTVKANGTSTALTVFNLNLNISKLVTGKNYILSGCTGGNFGTTYALRIINDGGSSLTINNGGDTGFSKTSAMTRLQIIIWSGQTLNNVVFKPMIRLSSDTDATYEPFMGNTFTIDWSNIAPAIYGGHLDVTNGLLTSTKSSDGSDLATPNVYQVKPVPFNTLLGQNNIWSLYGDVSVKYRADIARYVLKQLQ